MSSQMMSIICQQLSNTRRYCTLLTPANEEVIDGASLLDLTLVESKDMELCNIVHVDGHANLWRSRRVGVSCQESKENGVGAIEELLDCVGVDVASDHVPKKKVSTVYSTGITM
jgi:hypothetical protein